MKLRKHIRTSVAFSRIYFVIHNKMLLAEHPMLEVKNVKKDFKRRIKTWKWVKDLFTPKHERFHALKGISFNIQQWEKVAFIWPNGAWKSTTIKAILWILHYDSWKIRIFGKEPLTEREEIAKQTASVFGQRSQLLYHLPLIDSFNFFKIMYDIPQEKFEERLNKFSEKFWLKEFLDQPVRKLSLGQRMKWEIVASLLHEPKAIFLDEPTVWLDIIAKKVLYEILNEINKKENVTIFLTSHDLNDIENLCDRAIIINKWEILYDWQLEDLMVTKANKKFIRYKSKDTLQREEIVIENDPQVVQKTLKFLFENKEVEDVKVENVPLEDVIEEFYH